MWLKIGQTLLSVLHWCTGWLVHPDKGGCCHQDQILDDVKKTYDDLKK